MKYSAERLNLSSSIKSNLQPFKIYFFLYCPCDMMGITNKFCLIVSLIQLQIKSLILPVTNVLIYLPFTSYYTDCS